MWLFELLNVTFCLFCVLCLVGIRYWYSQKNTFRRINVRFRRALLDDMAQQVKVDRKICLQAGNLGYWAILAYWLSHSPKAGIPTILSSGNGAVVSILYKRDQYHVLFVIFEQSIICRSTIRPGLATQHIETVEIVSQMDVQRVLSKYVLYSLAT